MSKLIYTPIMLALLSTQLCADPAAKPTTPPTENSSAVITAPAAEKATTTTTTTTTTTPAAAPTAATLDCNYHIPADQKNIDSTVITQWAEKAALQSFSFTPGSIDTQLETLKSCYTEQGWKGFSEALQKSGNVDSIKTQSLNVSSQTDGVANINAVKDDQWKVTLPVQVVYQNDKEKVTQHLAIGILVGRKPNGDLGIMQLVATAKPDESVQPENAAPKEAPVQTPAKDDMVPMTPGANDTPEALTPNNKAKTKTAPQ
jgi:hypothetical protein